MTGSEFIQGVALRMDEITPGAGLSVTVDGSDGNPLYDLIEGVLDEAVMEVYATAPYWRIPTSIFASSDIEVATIPGDDSRKMIRLKVPGDFLRIAEVSCKYFHRPISEVYPKQSVMGKRQYNKHLRAGVARPVGIMSSGVWDTAANRQIECYSVPSTATKANSDITATYIAKPVHIDHDTSDVPIPEALIPALEWLAAAKAFGARGDTNHVAICQKYAQELLV